MQTDAHTQREQRRCINTHFGGGILSTAGPYISLFESLPFHSLTKARSTHLAASDLLGNFLDLFECKYETWQEGGSSEPN